MTLTSLHLHVFQTHSMVEIIKNIKIICPIVFCLEYAAGNHLSNPIQFMTTHFSILSLCISFSV